MADCTIKCSTMPSEVIFEPGHPCLVLIGAPHLDAPLGQLSSTISCPSCSGQLHAVPPRRNNQIGIR